MNVQWATLLVLSATLTVVAVYTWKTWQLAEEAKKQNDTILRPILVLSFSQTRVDNDDNLEFPTLTNIGFGPAFEIQIAAIEHRRYRSNFNKILFLKKGSQETVIPTTLRDGEHHNVGSLNMKYFVALLREGTERMDDHIELPLQISYVDANGKQYTTRQLLRCERPVMNINVTYEGVD